MAPSAWPRPFRSERAPGVERPERNGWGGEFREPRFRGVSADEVGLGERVAGGQAPALGAAHEKTALFQGVQSLTEAGVVHAQPLTQRSPGQRSSGTQQLGAHLLGQR